MSARREGSLLLRIYLVSVGVLVLLAFVVGLLANVLLVDPWQDFHAPRLRYAAGVFGSTWASDQALEQELQRMRDVGRYQAAVFDWAGRVRASTFEAAPLPLTEAQRARLLEGGVIRLSKACFPAFCPVATLVESQGARVGYAVFHSDVELPRQALIPLGALFGGLLMAAVLLARTFTVPLQRLAAAARALGEGDLSTRTGLHRADEIGQVARAFDEMAARMTAVLESQTVLLANVAHELRTPLTRIRLALDLAADEDLETARGSLAEIATDLDELEQLVTATLMSARMDLQRGRAPSAAPPLSMDWVDLLALVETACARVRAVEPTRKLTLECGEHGESMIRGDPALLRRVLENLLDNARKYSDPGQPIVVQCRKQGAALEVAVIDRGIGISAGDLAKVGTPFFRADRSRARQTGGVGLGLSLSQKIAEAHGGTLTLESEPGLGTTARLRLPWPGSREPEP